MFGYIFLRKSAYRDFLHIILKHTQAGIIIICTEEREEVMTGTKKYANFGKKWYIPPNSNTFFVANKQ